MRLVLSVALLFAVSFAASANVTIKEAKGWFESCFVSWTNEVGFESYNVYVKQSGGVISSISITVDLHFDNWNG